MTCLALSKHTRNVLENRGETEFLAQQVNGNTEEKQIQGFLDTRNPWRGNHRGRFPQFAKELLKGISPLHWHSVAHPGEPRVRRCMPTLDYRFQYFYPG